MASESVSPITRPTQEILGRNPGYGFAGIGVNTAIGNYTQSDIDLGFPGGTLGLLDLTRTYNSGGTAAGTLGLGWVTTHSASLTPASPTPPPPGEPAPGPVTFHDEDGRVLTFTPSDTGGYNRAQDLNADLTQASDGSYTLAFSTGEAWAFDPAGRLTGKTSEGQSVSYDYDSDGRLQRAAHSAGASLSWGSWGNRFQSISPGPTIVAFP